MSWSLAGRRARPLVSSLVAVRSFFAELRSFSRLTSNHRRHAEESGVGQMMPDFRDLARQACVSKLVLRKAERCKDLFVMPKTASVLECVRHMVEHKIGSSLIVDERTGALHGIFTERDYARRIALEKLDSSQVLVSDVMTRNPVCVTPAATIDDCVEAMLSHNCRHLPVVEASDEATLPGERGRLLGVLSIRDIVQELYWIKKTVHAQNRTSIASVLQRKQSANPPEQPKQQAFVGLAPSDSVLDALRCMQENDIGAVCISRGQHIAGIFTDRDYLRRVLLQGRRSSTTPLSEVMSERPVCALQDFTVEQSIGMMLEGNFRHLPIVDLCYDVASPSDDDEWRCVGVLSIKDLLAAMAIPADYENDDSH